MAASWKFALRSVWALAVGCSVTAQLCCTVVLNKRPPEADQDLHSFYISNISLLLGAVFLLPRSVQAPTPCRRPTHWWSVLGGIYTLLTCLTIPAGNKLGVQVVLLTQLLAIVSTALIFDLRKGRVHITDARRLGGFAVVLIGVALENVGAESDGGEDFSLRSLLLLVGVFASGVGYALQAKCNTRLARDFGSTSRTTLFSSLVSIVAGMPLEIVIATHYHVLPTVMLRDWPLWLFVGLQSAFYIASLSQLPVALGYTTSYLLLLVGKLLSSSFADAMGFTGRKVPFTIFRACAVLLVFIGTGFFSYSGAQHHQEEQPGTQEDISAFDPAFVDPSLDGTGHAEGAGLKARIAATSPAPEGI